MLSSFKIDIVRTKYASLKVTSTSMESVHVGKCMLTF